MGRVGVEPTMSFRTRASFIFEEREQSARIRQEGYALRAGASVGKQSTDEQNQ
jgi:hypothetical protein